MSLGEADKEKICRVFQLGNDSSEDTIYAIFLAKTTRLRFTQFLGGFENIPMFVFRERNIEKSVVSFSLVILEISQESFHFAELYAATVENGLWYRVFVQGQLVATLFAPND